MRTLTIEEAYDRAIRGILTQGLPSLEGLSCRYRTDDGLACAVGQLVTDAEHAEALADDPMLETSPPTSYLAQCGVTVEPDTRAACSALAELQYAHDDARHAPGLFLQSFSDRILRHASRLGITLADDLTATLTELANRAN